MSEKPVRFQPGVMLHDAVVGAFRASGSSFERWCADHGVTPTNARNATYGVMKGPKGQELLARLIEAAGPEVVKAGYLARFQQHAAELNLSKKEED